jgi:hypothetical protein
MSTGSRKRKGPRAGLAISDQLREAIRKRGLSSYAVGQAADINPAIVQRFMGRIRDLRLETVDRIAAALGLRLAEGVSRTRATGSRAGLLKTGHAPARDPGQADTAHEVEPIEAPPAASFAQDGAEWLGAP